MLRVTHELLVACCLLQVLAQIQEEVLGRGKMVPQHFPSHSSLRVF